jgi:hypothetical protein
MTAPKKISSAALSRMKGKGAKVTDTLKKVATAPKEKSVAEQLNAAVAKVVADSNENMKKVVDAIKQIKIEAPKVEVVNTTTPVSRTIRIRNIQRVDDKIDGMDMEMEVAPQGVH